MGELIFLAGRRPAVAAPARIVSGICDALLPGRRCLGLLAYEHGKWVHTFTCHSCAAGGLCDDPDMHRGCDSPEPRDCAHATCRNPADVDQVCVTDEHAQCDGCCWETDPREGARRWRTI